MIFGVFGSGEIIRKQIEYLMAKGQTLGWLVPDPSSDYAWEGFEGFLVSTSDPSTADFIIVNEYRRLIPTEHISVPVFNFHGGDLPRNRGNSSNLMSYMNGKDVVMSVHVLNEFMDDGEVLGKYRIQYDSDSPYSVLRNEMEEGCISLIDTVLRHLEENRQEENKRLDLKMINYSVPLIPEDGIIIDYSWPIQYYRRLWNIFGTGTGVFIQLKSSRNKIRVLSLELIECKRDPFLLVGAISNVEGRIHLINVSQGYLKVELERGVKIGTRLVGAQFNVLER